MGFGACLEFETDRSPGGRIDAGRFVSAAMPTLCTMRFSRSWFWDRPDVTRMILMARVDPPSLMGLSLDRIGR